MKALLGSGAFGTVFLAEDPEAGCEVALKVPHLTTLLTPELRQRFLREAEAASDLDHPNLVKIREAGEAGLVCYIATEYVPGTTLADWLREQREANRPVPPAEAVRLTRILAEAIQHAHDRDVLHCDLKPANILLRQAEVLSPLITDFGLARMVGDHSDLSQTGQLLGTPSYMAPEQAAGRRRLVTVRTDVYALGAVLYEMLTGRPPFVGRSLIDVLSRVMGEEPTAIRSLSPYVPAELETICLKCLHKEPSRRYGSAQELADDLGRFLDGQPIEARPISAWERVWKWARRRPAAATFAVLSVVTLLSITAVSVGYNAVLSRTISQLETTVAQRDEAIADRGRKEADLEKSRQEADAARARAEQRSREHRQTLEKLVALGQDGSPTGAFRRNEPRLALLRETARSYQGLLRARPEDGSLLEDTARLLVLLGQEEQYSRQVTASQGTFRAALVLWERLAAREPKKVAFQIERAVCQSRLGLITAILREPTAEQELRQAVLCWQALPGALASERDKMEMAFCCRYLADELTSRGRISEAQREYQRACDWIDRFCQQDPKAELLRVVQLGVWDARGQFHMFHNQQHEAVRCWKHVVRLAEGLPRPLTVHSPGAPYFTAACLYLVGHPYVEPYYPLGLNLGEQEWHQAESQVASDPDNAGRVKWLMEITERLMGAHLRANRQDNARQLVERMAGLHARLPRGLQTEPSKPGDFAEWMVRQTELLKEVHPDREALASARATRDLLTRYVRDPKRQRPLIWLADLVVRVSAVLRVCESPKEALDFLEETWPVVQRAVHEKPNDVERVLRLREIWEQIGKCHIELKQPDRAVVAWLRGVELLRRLLKDQPACTVARELLAGRCRNLGKHFLEQDRRDEARTWLLEARKLRPEKASVRREIEEALRKLAEN